MYIQLPEDLGCIQEVLILEDPVKRQLLAYDGRVLVGWAHFFALNANKGRFRSSAIQYPLIRKRNVRKACTAASGTM